MSFVLEDFPDLKVFISEPVSHARTRCAATPPTAGAPAQPDAVAALVAEAAEGDAYAWQELVTRFGDMMAAVGRPFRVSGSGWRGARRQVHGTDQWAQ